MRHRFPILFSKPITNVQPTRDGEWVSTGVQTVLLFLFSCFPILISFLSHLAACKAEKGLSIYALFFSSKGQGSIHIFLSEVHAIERNEWEVKYLNIFSLPLMNKIFHLCLKMVFRRAVIVPFELAESLLWVQWGPFRSKNAAKHSGSLTYSGCVFLQKTLSSANGLSEREKEWSVE